MSKRDDIRKKMEDFLLAREFFIAVVAAIGAILGLRYQLSEFLIRRIARDGTFSRDALLEVTLNDIVSWVIDGILIVALLAAVAYYIFFAFTKRKRKKQEGSLNPYLTHKSFEVSLIQRKMSEYEVIKKVEIQALRHGINNYRLNPNWTGSERENFSVIAQSSEGPLGVTKVMPKSQTSNTYAVVFNEMKKDETKKITIKYQQLGDTQGIMKKKLCVTTLSSIGCKNVTLRVVLLFDHLFKKAVQEKNFYRSLHGPLPLSDKPCKEAVWRVHEERKIAENEWYCVTWERYRAPRNGITS